MYICDQAGHRDYLFAAAGIIKESVNLASVLDRWQVAYLLARQSSAWLPGHLVAQLPGCLLSCQDDL